MPKFDISSEQIKKIRRILFSQEIEIHLKSEWGAQGERHSEEIHTALKKNKEKGDKFSISHTHDMGGYAVLNSPGPWSLGFDIEMIDRVSPNVVRRVSFSTTETEKAPSSESLWTAKEACFKALQGSTQPTVISQIEIGSWTTFDSQIETYKMQNAQTFGFSVSYGVVFKEHPYCFSVFLCRI